MQRSWRQVFRCIATAAALGLAGLAPHAAGVQLFEESSGLLWSEAEVQAAADPAWAAMLQRAASRGELGCALRCEQIERVFAALVRAVASQPGRAGRIGWRLTVVRSGDVDALASPRGQLVLSERFVIEREMHDAMVAFVLAHEMAHSVHEHERQVLTGVHALLPRIAARTVHDMVVELDFNAALRNLMAPLALQCELDADEHGLLLAALAGYPPERALDFMRGEAALEDPRASAVQTHPSAHQRLRLLLQQIPLARRVWQQAGAAG